MGGSVTVQGAGCRRGVQGRGSLRDSKALARADSRRGTGATHDTDYTRITYVVDLSFTLKLHVGTTYKH